MSPFNLNVSLYVCVCVHIYHLQGLFIQSPRALRVSFAHATAQGFTIAAMAKARGFDAWGTHGTSKDSVLPYLKACFRNDGVHIHWRDPNPSLEALHALAEAMTLDKEIFLATPVSVPYTILNIGLALIIAGVIASRPQSIAANKVLGMRCCKCGSNIYFVITLSFP
jgi:hypothetical protein